MSYMRGDIYLWDDGESVHIWSATGRDNWERTGWGEWRDGEKGTAGIQLEQAVMDEYVVMRFAELDQEGKLTATIERALKKWKGNGGCVALVKISSEGK